MECAHHGLLLRRSHPAEDGVRVDGLLELRRVFSELAGIQGIVGAGHARLGGDGADSGGVVTGDHLDGDLLVEEVAHRLGRVGAQALIDDNECSRGDLSRPALGIGTRARRPSEEQHARALSRESLGALAHLRIGVAEHDLGCAQEPCAVIVEGRCRPLARAGEGDALDHRPGRVGVGLRDRRKRGVGALLRGAHRGEGGVDVDGRVEHLDVGHGHARLGQRARLVDAHRVDTGQHFNSGQVLNEHLALRETDDGDRHCDAREEDKALGHHRHNASDRAPNRIIHGLVGAQLGDEEQDPDGWDHEGRETHELRNVIAQLGLGLGELLGLLGEPGSK